MELENQVYIYICTPDRDIVYEELQINHQLKTIV